MSIIETFDGDGTELIDPYAVVERIDGFPETVVSAFAQGYADLVRNTMNPRQISSMSGGRPIPVYEVDYDDNVVGFYHSLLGGAASAYLAEEVFAMGAKRILFFGSCGSLDKAMTSGHLIVPIAAYRDEGASYHYAAASDYIEVKTADRLATVLDGMSVRYTKAKTWTTDCFYRETQANLARRKQDGCAVVEMECASVMATGQFRNKDVYEFLYAADCLDDNCWDQRLLGNMSGDMRERLLGIAFEAAIRLG